MFLFLFLFAIGLLTMAIVGFLAFLLFKTQKLNDSGINSLEDMRGQAWQH